MLFHLTDFLVESAATAGGKTGSMRVPLRAQADATPVYYQLKPSILDNSRTRRIKAGGTDRENFGEVIAAAIARPLLPGIIPEVSLVYDPAKQRVAIASKYLTGVKIRTLDDYAREQGVETQKGKHVKFVRGVAAAGEYSLDTDPHIKRGIARAIAVSMLTGDHDINPGNMIVIQDSDGNEHVARIDFGHAFDDLINAPTQFGGGLRNKKNRALDFINRRNVAGTHLGFDSINSELSRLKIGSPSKLWRDYPGLIPSQEFADALAELSDPANVMKLREGTLRARSDFQQLLHRLETENDQAGILHLKKTLAAIHNNIADPKNKINPDKFDADQLIKIAFNQIYTFSVTNLKQMREAADIMQLQVNIDRFLASDTSHENAAAIAQIQKEYDALCKKYNKTKITWTKTHPIEREVTGTLQEYVRKRAKQLGITHTFQFSVPSTLVTSITLGDEHYSVVQPLTGRGQPGFAAFCRAVGQDKELLVKVDNAGTCLAEATANVLPSHLTPRRYQRSANFADLSIKDPTHDPQVVSIQSRVTPRKPGNKIIPLDQIVYGKKRDPKTLISYERKYNHKITQFLENASEDVKWQFASALFASVAAGDESSHLGQFMAEVNRRGEVVGITRIDFGAANRYARARAAKDDFDPLHTSQKYARSGQFGKDYINYLLRDKSVRSKYLALWKQDLDLPQISRQTESNFIEKLQKLPEEQRILAIQEMVATINKGAKPRDKFTVPGVDLKHILPDDLAVVEAALAREMAVITTTRMQRMSEKAKALPSSSYDQKQLAKMHARDKRDEKPRAAAAAPQPIEDQVIPAPVAVRQPLLSLPLDHGRRAAELRTEQARYQPLEFVSESDSDADSPSYSIQMTDSGLVASIGPEYQPMAGSELLCLNLFLITYLGNLTPGSLPPVMRTDPTDDPILAANFYACAQLLKAAGMPLEIKGLEQVTTQENVDQAKQVLARIFNAAGRDDAAIGRAIINQKLAGPSGEFFSEHVSGNISRKYTDRDISGCFGTLLTVKDLCEQATGANDLIKSINDYLENSSPRSARSLSP